MLFGGGAGWGGAGCCGWLRMTPSARAGGWETGTFLASREPRVRQPRAWACPWLCPAHPQDALLPASPPLLRTLPEAQVGSAFPGVCCTGVWRESWAGGWVGIVSAGKAGIFSSTARLPCLPPLPSAPPAVGGPHNPPSTPCHLLKISPAPFWFIFCSDVCFPHAHPPPTKTTVKGNRCELGCGAASQASAPSMMF